MQHVSHCTTATYQQQKRGNRENNYFKMDASWNPRPTINKAVVNWGVYGERSKGISLCKSYYYDTNENSFTSFL